MDYLLLTEEEQDKFLEQKLEKIKQNQEEQRILNEGYQKAVENVDQSNKIERLKRSLNTEIEHLNSSLKSLYEDYEEIADKQSEIAKIRSQADSIIKNYEKTADESQKIEDIKESIKKLDQYNALLEKYKSIKSKMRSDLYLNEMVGLLNEIHLLYTECNKLSLIYAATLFENEIKELNRNILQELAGYENEIDNQANLFKKLFVNLANYVQPTVYLTHEDISNDATEDAKNLFKTYASLTSLNKAKSNIEALYKNLENALSDHFTKECKEKIDNIKDMKEVINRRFENAEQLLEIKSDIEENADIQIALNDMVKKLESKYTDYKNKAKIDFKSFQIEDVDYANETEQSLKEKFRTLIEKNQMVNRSFDENFNVLNTEIKVLKNEITKIEQCKYRSTHEVHLSNAFKDKLRDLGSSLDSLEKKVNSNRLQLQNAKLHANHKKAIEEIDEKIDKIDIEHIQNQRFHLVTGTQFEKIKKFILENSESYKKITHRLKQLESKQREGKITDKEYDKLMAIKAFIYGVENSTNLQRLLNLTLYSKESDDFYVAKHHETDESQHENIVIHGLDSRLRAKTGWFFPSKTDRFLNSLSEELHKYININYEHSLQKQLASK